jgi:hypothetical protein
MNLQEKIDALPASIWMPGNTEPSIYRGTPTEIVTAMAAEIGEGVSIRDAVRQLCSALAEHRHVGIRLPLDLPDEQLAGLFVYALLDTRLARPMASA